MISVKLQGRLGNQMFQFAFAYLTSKKRGESFFILRNSSKYALHYFELNGQKFNPFQNTLKQLFFQLSPLKQKTLFQIGMEEPDSILKESAFCRILDGYFQSELFFNSNGQAVKKLFAIQQEYQLAFNKKYKTFFETNKTIVLHVRRTDYLKWNIGEKYGGENPSLPFSYYESVLKKFDLNKYKIVFISDDIEAVKIHFGTHENYHYENNNEIIDLQLLQHADVLCISNSSFSWWGAYLNEKPNKLVFAPKYWLGFKTGIEYPKNIICEEWTEIEIPLSV